MAGQWRCWPNREKGPGAGEMEPISEAALDSKRADKNGGVSLGMDSDFILFGNKGISVFCTREWLGAGETPAPTKMGTLLIKPFFLPHQLLCYACIQQSAANPYCPVTVYGISKIQRGSQNSVCPHFRGSILT